METNRSIFDFSLDDDSKYILKTTAVWATICAVAGFISLALTIITSAKNLTATSRYSPSAYVTGFILGIGIYSVISFFLNYFILQFGSKTKKALVADDQAEFNNGLRNLKMYIRFCGIILIAIILIVLLVVIFGIFYK